jgi:FixJ family two-component response regulator
LEERVEQSGGYALFQKPFETEDLLATIQGALQLREEKVAWLRHVSGW